jgi:phospholipid/cholesterol/gamma-HCH transport system permease protein
VNPDADAPRDSARPESIRPESMRPSRISAMPLPPPAETIIRHYKRRTLALLEHLGDVVILSRQTFRMAFKRPLEGVAIIHQMDSLGVKSMGIVAVTSLFIGMVMTIQFAYGLSRFGGIEYIPRVVVLSFARELAPTLTAVIVGGRIGSGMAAEVGAMNVTEQVDAIRALGADPAKKLVLPRVVAAMTVMPLLSIYALVLGTLGAIIICDTQFDISPQFFLRSSLQSVLIEDVWSGLAKTPVFGFLIAIIGCHFGLRTTGGTEGVGTSTTRTVVVVSISILVADFMLTKLFIALSGAA